MKKKLLWLMMPFIALTFTGCYDTMKHLEHHAVRAYQQLDSLHKELDWYIFDLDEQNPDHWP